MAGLGIRSHILTIYIRKVLNKFYIVLSKHNIRGWFSERDIKIF